MPTVTRTPAVYLYSGEFATNPTSVEQISIQLQNYGISPSRIISLPDESYLARALKDEVGSLIFPEGSSPVLIMGLQSSIWKIRRAVDRGWGFLGVSAGANYASRSMSVDHPRLGLIKDFERDMGGQFLQLLPVHAYTLASQVETMRMGEVNNVQIIQVTAQPSEEVVSVVWNEGSIFTPVSEDVRVEAVYSDIEGCPICACSGTYGRGNVVISAVQPEVMEVSNSAIGSRYTVNKLFSRFFQLTVDPSQAS